MTQLAAPAPAAVLARLDESPVRVLVVDDEKSLTDLLGMALRYEGWIVSSAATGLAAVRAARDVQPDAVLLDMMLPDLDGLEVARVRRYDHEVTLDVDDDGPGIPASLQRDVFQRFTRGDSSRSRIAGSTGLGLSIVNAVVTAHGGIVTPRSRPGHTQFTVTLPISAAPAPQVHPPHTHAPLHPVLQ